MTDWLRKRPTGLALASSVAAALAWFALASATGLIFHVMPAAPTLAAAYVVRWAVDRPPSRARRSAILALGASIAAAMSLILGFGGRPLDEPPLTVLAILGGVVIGAWLMRPGGSDGARATTDPTDVRHHTVQGVEPD
ncbi:MAG TPA: hypothetical protein VF971_01475 [Candidatus Limnocylindrales bacterium]